MNEKTEAYLRMAEEAIQIIKARGKEYDNNGFIEENAHARIMSILFPNGSWTNVEDITRYKLVSNMVDKLCRYRLNFKKDNLLDLANYAFILAAFDEEIREKEEKE